MQHHNCLVFSYEIFNTRPVTHDDTVERGRMTDRRHMRETEKDKEEKNKLKNERKKRRKKKTKKKNK